MSIGKKRNKLVESSTGEIIVHFDDDDYYGPRYVEDVVSRLSGSRDVLLLSGFFVAPLNLDCFGYYMTQVKRGLGFAFGKSGNSINVVALEKLNIPWIHLAWGFSFAYKRKVWDKGAFPDSTGTEDKVFVIQAIKNGFDVGYYQDLSANVVHTIHASATSNCFSQFLVPPFMMQSLNLHAFDRVARLKEIYSTECAARQGSQGPRPGVAERTTAYG
jgi:cellulose synthase/poly-beta-1,6-N-acetylglucosamine synthase-like glycosyltransferase